VRAAFCPLYAREHTSRVWNCLTLASSFGLFRLTAPGKIPSMTDLDGATIKLKRIGLKKCVFKGTIIGPNPR
jgi:hypothetical protein